MSKIAITYISRSTQKFIEYVAETASTYTYTKVKEAHDNPITRPGQRSGIGFGSQVVEYSPRVALAIVTHYYIAMRSGIADTEDVHAIDEIVSQIWAVTR
mgnify:CR=1 FL=1|tara:strand:+ start:848 stop:1147 length:300 start_codon:yes stop_codon:yes gene_type:complete